MRALISVSDKTGIVELAKELTSLGVEIISTGGTYKKLQEEGVKAIEISELTGFPECLDGRVIDWFSRMFRWACKNASSNGSCRFACYEKQRRTYEADRTLRCKTNRYGDCESLPI